MSEQKSRSINKMAKELWHLARSQGFQVDKIEFDISPFVGPEPRVTVEGKILDDDE